jgi:hypothetical protein
MLVRRLLSSTKRMSVSGASPRLGVSPPKKRDAAGREAPPRLLGRHDIEGISSIENRGVALWVRAAWTMFFVGLIAAVLVLLR